MQFLIKSRLFILISFKEIFCFFFSYRNYALHLERIRLILMLILPQITSIKSLFLLQTHLLIQIFVILSFIATFFIVPIPRSEKNISMKNE